MSIIKTPMVGTALSHYTNIQAGHFNSSGVAFPPAGPWRELCLARAPANNSCFYTSHFTDTCKPNYFKQL